MARYFTSWIEPDASSKAAKSLFNSPISPLTSPISPNSEKDGIERMKSILATSSHRNEAPMTHPDYFNNILHAKSVK